MKFLFNYTKLFLWSTIYYFQPKDIVLDLIIKNIQDSGCIAIKFTQWILPKLEMIYDLDSKKDIWFGKLEQFYEYCNIHDIGYTKILYENDFSEKITDDYLIESVIGSGSIGQVYKIKDKKTNKYYALKVVHPNLLGQIIFMKYLMEDYDVSDYDIIFSNQIENTTFNRGAMKNIAFLYIKEKYPKDYKNIIFIFNDIDTLPYTKNLLDYNISKGEIKHYYGYKFALGGIFSITGEDFEKINGFPNYWGWGFEDNVMNKRAIQHKININRNTFYPIRSMEILHFFDEINKQMDRNTLNTQFIKGYQEEDGLKTIRDLNYKMNQETKMLDVFHFKSKYNHNQIKPFLHNITTGNKFVNPENRRSSSMKMQFF